VSILDRDSLEKSPLADLHAIASELSIDGYRRLRKAELIDVIVARQEGRPPAEAEAEAEGPEPGDAAEAEAEAEGPEPGDAAEEEPANDQEASGSRRRWRRGGRGRAGGEGEGSAESSDDESSEAASPGPAETDVEAEGPEARPAAEPGRADQDVVEGVVELLAGGSGFVRVNPPGPSDDDVYISSAQIKRCELVTGDRVSGPRRAPRRSERFASLLRVDTFNDRPASELADSVRFEDRPAAFPDRRLSLATGDSVLAAIEQVAPIGRGSRVTIFGPAASGKTDVLRRVASALSQDQTVQVWLVLVGVRPEELTEWQGGPLSPAVSLTFAASADTQSQAVDGVVEQVRRLVARGGDAVILIDTLDGVIPGVARKALASSRNLVDGGTLTVIATASAPLGGETTAIALERSPSGQPEYPLVDRAGSWTIRAELLG
jgi:transcription termination factor Rho